MSSGARMHIIVMLPRNISVEGKFALSCRQHLTQPKTSFPKSEVNPLLQPFGRGLCLLHPLSPHLLPLSLLPSFRMGYFHSPLHLLVLQDAAPARSPHSGLSGSKVRATCSREFTQPRLPKSTRPLEARGEGPAWQKRSPSSHPAFNDNVAVEKPEEEETEENKEGDHAREIAHRFRPCFAGSLSCPLPLPVSCPSRKQACSHHSTAHRSLCRRSPPVGTISCAMSISAFNGARRFFPIDLSSLPPVRFILLRRHEWNSADFAQG